MDWELILQIFITSVIAPLLILITKEVIGYLKSKSNAIADESLSLAVKESLNELDNAVTTAVSFTQQVFVDALKKDGKFTPADANKAAMLALSKTKQIMSDYAYETLQMATGAAEDRIKAAIEEKVRDLRKWEE